VANHPFVLVHGAYHGSWCFEKLMNILREQGHAAKGIDLPLCPDRTTPVTMGDCMAAMEAAIPEGCEPVILCGHSNGGHFISAFAEKHPERVKELVYITATLLPSGCSAFDEPVLRDDCPKPRRESNAVCKWYPVETEEDFVTVWNYFYSGAQREDARWAVERILPQPLDCLGTPNTLTTERYGSVPRSYVLCTADRCMSPALQRAMLERVPCTVYEMDSGHSPFMTHPRELAEILCEIKKTSRSFDR